MILETFLSTLLGAFLGVAGPFAIDRILEWRNFRRALDAVFIQSDLYLQLVKARTPVILRGATASQEPFSVVAARLLRINIDPLERYAPALVASYAKFLRAEDVFLLGQAESNLGALFINLAEAATAGHEKLREALDAYIEHAARRSWLVYVIAAQGDEPFSPQNYNRLVAAVSEEKGKRVTKLEKLKLT